MNLFEKLFLVCVSTTTLDSYLYDNLQEVNDFNNSEFDSLKGHRESVEKFILSKYPQIESLDYSKSYNRAFISILLDLCERFHLISSTPRIYAVFEENDIYIGHRLEAALLYLYNIDSNSRLVERFDLICKHIQTAIEIEEDNEVKALSTFLNYYANVIINTPLQFSEKIKLKIVNAIEQSRYQFIQSASIVEALSVNLINAEMAFEQIQSIIDRLLNKFGAAKEVIIFEEEEILLIEENTEYCEILKHTNKSFKSIRRISTNQFISLENKNEVYNSLGRGVAILENESQMFSYMNSFGNAHHAKMVSALNKIPFIEINNEVEIFDWSCGQGLASMVFFDYLKTNNISLIQKKINLIEPSIVCLKRAALHVKFYDKTNEIRTICKDLDSLEKKDVSSNSVNIKIHFFSNILDVDDFSIVKLIELIESSQKGSNYFICVSPYITDAKADRINSFIRYFQSKYNTFQALGDETNGGRLDDEYWNCNNKYNNSMCSSHPITCNGEKKWTRIIKVFKVDI